MIIRIAMGEGEVLFIRCSPENKKKFRRLVVDHDFKSYEDALETLVMMAENHPELVKKSKVRYLVSSR